MARLVIWASGSGTNAENIIRYFNVQHPEKGITVSAVYHNRKDAGVRERAERLGVKTRYIGTKAFDEDAPEVLETLHEDGADYVILAGFLRKVPQSVLTAYEGKMLNIHPALLPKYGGKGMYGHHVHEAVCAAGERRTGITIHLVDGQYDHGKAIFRAACRVERSDSPERVAEKVHELEMRHFPPTINRYVNERK